MTSGRKVIAFNRKASHEYFLEDRFEAGLVLKGTEIKSIRKGHVQLKDAYISFTNGEAFIKEMHIPEYVFGNRFNHDETRIRKLLPVSYTHLYNYPHIGNARPIVVFDTLKRTFMALGYKVKMVSNYTDVDDKIIKVAKECGISEKEVTEKFIKAYNDDRLALHAMMPDAAPKVTETMDAIIAFIDLLVKKEHAYVVDGDVYFRVSSVENYGKLSNQQIDDLMAVSYTHLDVYKRQG